MFERKHEKVVPVSIFARRVLVFAGFAFILIFSALAIGIAGYHWIARLSWIDSFLNASMILGGMGPVNILTTTGAKLFAGFYALFSGLVFIAVMGIVLTPVVHRILHKFHVDK
ncbi:MAG: hypothetical protein HQL25_08820 [Candidatus Omnitrophica bacterium]|nr:hypothetical protein [Candidatus Omnitrophota bacterium]